MLDFTASRESESTSKCFHMSLLKLQFEAAILAKHVLIIYTFVDNLPLTKMQKRFLYFSNFFMTHLLSITLFTYDNSESTVETSPKVWMFGKNDFDRTSFIIFVYNVMCSCIKNYKIK